MNKILIASEDVVCLRLHNVRTLKLRIQPWCVTAMGWTVFTVPPVYSCDFKAASLQFYL